MQRCPDSQFRDLLFDGTSGVFAVAFHTPLLFRVPRGRTSGNRYNPERFLFELFIRQLLMDRLLQDISTCGKSARKTL